MFWIKISSSGLQEAEPMLAAHYGMFCETVWPETRLLPQLEDDVSYQTRSSLLSVASFTKEVNPWLAKRPLVSNGRLVNRGLISLGKRPRVSQINDVYKIPADYHISEVHFLVWIIL